jgi:hypothetical protein
MMQLLAQAEKPVNFLQFNRAIWDSSGTVVSGKGDLSSPGGIISAAMPYLFSIAGLILFVMIVWGAFEIMTGATDPKNAESGKKRITAAVTGFLILFLSYWIGQIIQYVFGLNIGLK